MEAKFITLEDGNIAVSLPNHMLKLQDLEDFANESFEWAGLDHIKHKFNKEGRGNFPVEHHEFGRRAWLSSGIEAEILQPSAQGWQKGRVRFKISLEFQAISKSHNERQSDDSLDALRNNPG